MKYDLVLRDPQTGHAAFASLWLALKALLMAGHRVEIVAKTETRSSAQNRLLWQRLGEVSQQVTWYEQKLTAEEWKDVFSAAMKRQKVVPGLDGGFVILGLRTSKMTVAEMTEMLDLISAFGAERGVVFRDEVAA